MIFRIRLLFAAVLLVPALGAGAAAATVLSVEQDGSGDFTTIAGAVAAAQPGYTIEIGPGVYAEHLVVTAELTLRSTGGPATTVLDGANTGRILWVDGAPGCTLSGLTLTRGFSDSGAAIRLDGGGGLLLRDCVLADNFSTHDGGAIFVGGAGSSLEAADCAFQGNAAAWNCGAAAITQSAAAVFRYCTFAENGAGTLCGAVANFDDSPLTVEFCAFLRNASQAAGALLVQGSPATVRNCTFVGNAAMAADGATVNFYDGYAGVFERNIVAGTVAGYGVRMSSGPAHARNIFHANAAGAILYGTLDATEYEGAPLFCDRDGDDLALCADSPALAANNAEGLIGAFGEGCAACGAVPAEPTSWGRVKSVFR